MSDKVGLFVTFWAAPGKFDGLLEKVSTMMDTVMAETGTLVYGFHKVSDERGQGVSVYEVYENVEAQRIHGESAAINILKPQLAELLGRAPERYQLMPIPGSKGLPF